MYNVIAHVLLCLQDDVEFDTFFRERVVTARVSLRRKDQNAELNTGKMLSFTPGLGQQLNTTNFGDLQLSQKVRMRCLLSSLCLFSRPSSICKSVIELQKHDVLIGQ